MSLELLPISFKEACAFVREHHRHHVPPQGWKFGIAASDGERIVGVATVGRPVSRHLDNGLTLELTRLCCIEGARNASSFLMGAVRRATFALGYRRLVTYTLPSEGGASLRAAGYRELGSAGGGSWDKPSRPRVQKAPTEKKTIWECRLDTKERDA